MSSAQDFDKIIDYIYNHPDIPDDVRNHIRQWMASHEHDSRLDNALQRVWDREFGKASESVDPQSLSRLLNGISPNPASAREESDTGRRKSVWRRTLRYAAAVAAIVLASVMTYFITSSHDETRTVLLTAKGSVGEFQLPDGSTVRLNSDSRLSYTSDDFAPSGKRRVDIKGEAFFDVVKDPSRPFVVRMSDMEVEVLGTSFDVRNYSFSKAEEVVLLKGKVRVNGLSNGQSLTLEPDQRLVIDKENGKYSVENSPAINYCRWYEPRLKVENESLGDILITIGRKYCMDLKINPGVDTSTRLSLTLYNDRLEEIMPVIGYITGINWFVSDNTLIITE